MLHANITALCLIEWEFLPISFTLQAQEFLPFWLLWPWSWPDDLHIRTRPVDHGDIPHVQIRTSYVKAFGSYRLTDIPTDRHDQSYFTRRFVGGNNNDTAEIWACINIMKYPYQTLLCPVGWQMASPLTTAALNCLHIHTFIQFTTHWQSVTNWN